jgi:hypothetical protein
MRTGLGSPPVSRTFPGTSKWNKIEHRLFCVITAGVFTLPDEDLNPLSIVKRRSIAPDVVNIW